MSGDVGVLAKWTGIRTGNPIVQAVDFPEHYKVTLIMLQHEQPSATGQTRKKVINPDKDVIITGNAQS